MKNYEMLASDLAHFNNLEYEQKECVADYISCPSSNDCKYDGRDGTCCTECKIRWLESECE